jgi:predicted nucleotide-binding protein
MARPSVFVGSSSEGLKIASAIQILLDSSCEVELWTQGVFGLSQGTLESLLSAIYRFDFAIFVLTADDLTIVRNLGKNVARDNVIFELGIFMGSLGRDRTFMLYDRTNKPDLPSDLAGITATTFALRNDIEIINLSKYPDRKRAADAAIAFFCHTVEPPVSSWKNSTTWQIVKTIYERKVAVH